jgi:hypothetical protein
LSSKDWLKKKLVREEDEKKKKSATSPSSAPCYKRVSKKWGKRNSVAKLGIFVNGRILLGQIQ